MKLYYFKLDVTPIGMTVEITDRDISHGIWSKIFAILGGIDDAGCDWFTDNQGNTYIANREWHVSSDPMVAKLVDVANYMNYGHDMKIDDTKGGD